MINIIRKNQQLFMVMITILVIIAFVWLYNGVRWDRMGEDRIATIYGRTVTVPEYERAGRKFHLATDLGLFNFAQTLAAIGPNPGPDNFVWNLMVLENQSEALQIWPTNAQVASRIQSLPTFQTNGSFDMQKYGTFVDQALGPRGFTEAQLRDVVRDELRVESLKTLIGSTVSVSPGELQDLYQREYGKIDASVIRFELKDFSAQVTPSEEEIQKAYEAQKESLKSDEKRSIMVARFALPKEAADLPGRERTQALQKTADQAENLTQKLLDPKVEFGTATQMAGGEVTTTEPFTAAEPPASIDGSREVANAAFQLTPEQPNSDVIQAGDVFYVVHLEEVIPSQPLTYEQARSRLEDQIRTRQATEKLNLKATEVRNAMESALKGGKTFADAAKEAGVSPADFPVFSLAEPKFDVPDAPAVMQTAATMAKGELSQPVPTSSGSVLVYIKDRPKPDHAKFEADREKMANLLGRSKREVAFAEWLRLRRDASDLQVFARLR